MTSSTATTPSEHDDVDRLLSVPMTETIPMEALRPYLASPSWHSIDGAFNLRSVSYSPFVRPGLVYRWGMLALLSEAGRHDIVKSLGITNISDLRSNEERHKFPDPDIPGVEFNASDLSSVGKSTSEQKWTNIVEMLVFHLEEYRESFREMLLFVLNNPGKPFLVHCTGGKDRSGIAVALLLSIANVPRQYIAHDFALTRIEIEPVRELLQAKATVDINDERVKAIAGCDCATIIKSPSRGSKAAAPSATQPLCRDF
ncbi:hypothetical protein M409DRAFT_55486 [Zasmidium cellare ATCC 36951]|uniref:Tyrosine specific protein phosphatases domain-containing protein n=1 Tax=Zasmidium cellare ATCC 36951 TaxID=1080233 RepID=A0A6A6CEF4_ZASCE|nr:uncharacterized protein M409DRAFT_55486 [Zasmidium cellare ATCC 36951]KAF2165584.1 hypothetical protein M409DRAFT_55486 [Zasmidium cellare ATCC 36951]